MKKLWNKYKEVILYLVFGVITTVVALGIYYGTFLIAEYVFDFDLSDKNGALYIGIYITAQILQWVGGVLSAFFTNRAWVFTGADKNVSVWDQLMKFAGGRVVTFFLDLVLTYVFIMLLDFLLHGGDWPIDLFGLYTLHINAELISKLIVSVIVVVTNYVFSKIFVFKKKK